MALLKRRAISAFLTAAAFVFLVPAVSAQVTESREELADILECMIFTDTGFTSDCGVDHLNNEFVFVGTILTSAKTADKEFRLELRPEESFLGAPPNKLEVITKQGSCQPAFVPGDRWLFYLWRDKESQALYLEYMGGSEPEKDAQGQIAQLRRLAGMDQTGILRGSVARVDEIHNDGGTPEVEDIPLSNHRVIATSEDGKPLIASTNKDGDFEFQPLSPGIYELSANTTAGLWGFEGAVDIAPHTCAWASFKLEPNGQITGRLTKPDGKPARDVEVYAISSSDNRIESHTTRTDEDGHYRLNGLRPGHYLVGIKSETEEESSSNTPMKLKIYFPGVSNLEDAVGIDVGKAEKREHIDFQVPPSLVTQGEPAVESEPDPASAESADAQPRRLN
jgi:protocatechuate 3,4-dioxygenase beta subunit